MNRIQAITGKSDRRAILKGAAAIIGGCAAGGMLPASAGEKPAASAKASAKASAGADRSSESVVAAKDIAVVATEYGSVAGYIRNGMFTFKGIPYADTTEGAHRFMPPVKPKPWTGVRSSRQFGNVCPQGARTGWANDEEAFMFSWDDGVPSEDCLRLNIWSPAINDGGKRPVMVWLHGGGYSAGSGQELLSYDGENLSRRGDVVVVSLNHRLNALGYLNLSQYGEKYAASTNVGMLDIVAALEWVRDNIAAFGGDPGTVTIFGHSGGGGKVGTLMAMPSAKGLFHRAIVESSSAIKGVTRSDATKSAETILAKLGLKPNQLDELQNLPMDRVLSINAGGGPAGNQGLRLAPVVDGRTLPADPFDPAAPDLSAHVPLTTAPVR